MRETEAQLEALSRAIQTAIRSAQPPADAPADVVRALRQVHGLLLSACDALESVQAPQVTPPTPRSPFN
jgi:hypothetical protein